MGFPILAAAIHNAGLTQWRVAQLAGMSESRLSRIIRRGVASPSERERLCQLLGVSEAELFTSGPTVSLNVDRPEAEQTHSCSAERGHRPTRGEAQRSD